MRKLKIYLSTFVLASMISLTVFAQNPTISGKIMNSQSKESIEAVSIGIKGTSVGTFSNDKGDFKLSVSQKFPITLIINSIGFNPQELVVESAVQDLNVQLLTKSILGQEVVVSASKVPQKILESPVSIERISSASIKNSAVSSYYDILSSLNGVDFTTSSLTFKTPSTRGFNGSGSTRVNQIVDGMDNQAPGLNFAAGSIIGLTELDVDNMELLPGASSAL